jgi:hopanoid biosynthesis associated protein HpnK
VRRVIFNADDFGLTAGVNRGVMQAHTRGVVTSSTLMACGARFAEAAELAARMPGLSVGCHVVLLDGSPSLNVSENASDVSCLLSKSATQFRNGITGFAARALTGRLSEEQMEREITAQIRKLQEAGIKVSHVDSHKHTHMFPVVFRAMLRAAQNCGIRAVRNPFEPLLFFSMRNWKRQFQLGILSSFRASFRERLTAADMVTPDGCIGIAATGGLDFDGFRALMENLPEGTWEFVCHPGYNDDELARVKTRLRDSREKELALLTSDAVRKLLEVEHIDLISYRDLAVLAFATPKVPAPLAAKST